MTTPVKDNAPRIPPYKLAASGCLMVVAVVLALVYVQFRGDFTPKTKLDDAGPAGRVW